MEIIYRIFICISHYTFYIDFLHNHLICWWRSTWDWTVVWWRSTWDWTVVWWRSTWDWTVVWWKCSWDLVGVWWRCSWDLVVGWWRYSWYWTVIWQRHRWDWAVCCWQHIHGRTNGVYHCRGVRLAHEHNMVDSQICVHITDLDVSWLRENQHYICYIYVIHFSRWEDVKL